VKLRRYLHARSNAYNLIPWMWRFTLGRKNKLPCNWAAVTWGRRRESLTTRYDVHLVPLGSKYACSHVPLQNALCEKKNADAYSFDGSGRKGRLNLGASAQSREAPIRFIRSIC